MFCTYCSNSAKEEAYGALKRIDVEHWPEKALRQHVEDRLALLLDADPKTAYDILADLVLASVDIRKILKAQDIWQHLERHGIGPNLWHKDKLRIALINEITNRYLDRARAQTICGRIIPRPETQDLLSKLKAPQSKRAFVVTGVAGGGKSGLLLQAVDSLRLEGWPVLTFRLDNLNPAYTPDEIGKQLGLPLSPAQVLAAIAQGSNCLLVIDQLDAVSISYGRNIQSWDSIHDIITQALDYENMRVLLACRQFDLENDHRLRHLVMKSGVAEPFHIGSLDRESIRQVLESTGINPDQLIEKQLEILSLPLHLKLFADSVEDTKTEAPTFTNEIDLYNTFWEYKRKMVRNRLPNNQWFETIDALTDYMSKYQTTNIPKDRLDKFADSVEAMASEHVLIIDGDKISFFHDGFFDYAFARQFSARGDSLLELLQNDEQHLFRRSQVRQVLLYQREHHFESYINSLAELLTSPLIRFHIKSVIFDLLADLSEPTQEEWTILVQLIENKDDPTAIGVWRVLQGKTPWFNLLDSLTVWERWLASNDEELLNKVIQLLWTVQKHTADRVAELVEPYINMSEAWNN